MCFFPSCENYSDDIIMRLSLHICKVFEVKHKVSEAHFTCDTRIFE